MALKFISLYILILPTGRLLKQRELPKEWENTHENLLGKHSISDSINTNMVRTGSHK